MSDKNSSQEKWKSQIKYTESLFRGIRELLGPGALAVLPQTVSRSLAQTQGLIGGQKDWHGFEWSPGCAVTKQMKLNEFQVQKLSPSRDLSNSKGDFKPHT